MGLFATYSTSLKYPIYLEVFAATVQNPPMEPLAALLLVGLLAVEVKILYEPPY
jgi:hypothetical protein